MRMRNIATMFNRISKLVDKRYVKFNILSQNNTNFESLSLVSGTKIKKFNVLSRYISNNSLSFESISLSNIYSEKDHMYLSFVEFAAYNERFNNDKKCTFDNSSIDEDTNKVVKYLSLYLSEYT